MGFDNVCKLCGRNPTCHMTGGALCSWLLAVADLSCFVIPVSWGSFSEMKYPILALLLGGGLLKLGKQTKLPGSKITRKSQEVPATSEIHKVHPMVIQALGTAGEKNSSGLSSCLQVPRSVPEMLLLSHPHSSGAFLSDAFESPTIL